MKDVLSDSDNSITAEKFRVLPKKIKKGMKLTKS